MVIYPAIGDVEDRLHTIGDVEVAQDVLQGWRERTAMHNLTLLWLLGDYLRDAALKNDAIDALIGYRDSGYDIPIRTMSMIYDNTSAGSSLRRWLIDTLSVSLTES